MNKTYELTLGKILEAKNKGLKKLDLSFDYNAKSYEKLTKIPEEVFNLTQLVELDLKNNAITSVPESITKLQNLTMLSLNGNHLTILPKAVTRLQNLTTLDLSNNKLSTLPGTFNRLQNLNKLYVNSNQLTSLPESVTSLQYLTTIDLAGNKITTLPKALAKLQNLTTLDLSRNKLTTLPETITTLRNLTSLNLDDNQFNTLPEVIYDLIALQQLNLRGYSFYGTNYGTNNQIKKISPKILQLEHLEILDIDGNPIEIPPPEVVRKGLAAIKNYFRQLEAEGMDHLYEAKLLIVGEGGAGKTTFANKIVNQNYQLQESEKSTEGIAVTRWDFPMKNAKQFRVNIWDFGGQEIYHATHQFFLTKRSLYTLVADSRKEDTDFYYWLNIVELLSDNSPLMIVQNEKQDRRREINEGQLREQFSNLKETLRTNFSDNRGLKEIIDEIKHIISHLPQIGTPLPKTWIKVRAALEGDERNYIELDEYLAVCEQNGFKNEKDKLQLSSYLHDLGVCLHFQEDALLKKKVILKPKWGTDAVYKVLDNKTVLDNMGKFTKYDLAQVWYEPEYTGMQDELLQLMINFKLCYMIPNTPSYIAPQLLSVNQPEYPWDEKDNLFLRYTYTFMPKGIVTQLIVAMHTAIADQGWVWKSGVILKKDHTLAEVVEYYDQREIRIRVMGKHKRDLLTIIAHELDKIHASYPRLKFNKLIPCNCIACAKSQKPYFYPVEKLLEFVEKDRKEIMCYDSGEPVKVLPLLYDVFGERQLAQDDRDFGMRGGPDRFRDVYYINKLVHQHAHTGGDISMEDQDYMSTDNSKHISSNVVNSSNVAANVGESLSGITTTVTNTMSQLAAPMDVKALIAELAQHIENLDPKVDPEQVKQLGGDLKTLSEEAAKSEPRRKWYELSLEGLTEAATNIGTVGKPILATLEKLSPLLLHAPK